MPYWTDSHRYIELFIEPEDAARCHHPGECFPDVFAVSKELYIEKQIQALRPAIIAKVLKEYGAWTPKELKNHKENVIRLLWIATNDLAEEATQHETA